MIQLLTFDLDNTLWETADRLYWGLYFFVKKFLTED